MSRLAAICYGCDVSTDHAQNTRNHQEMIDRMNAEAINDGWQGAMVSELLVRKGFVALLIVPGVRPLTLDDLRRFKEERRAAQQQIQPTLV